MNTALLRPLVLAAALAAVLPLRAAPQEPAANTQRRIALVVGNGHYVEVSPLDNPLHDAADMCQALKDLGFEAMCYQDIRTRREFKDHLQEFVDRLRGGKAAGVIYYAGHGVQIDGENYLIPTQARIRRKEDIEDETISLRYIMSSLADAQNDFNLVVLDACRDNPFTRGFSRAITRGLAPMSDTPSGSLVLYATAANDQASDGDGRNSPFARHLLANIRQPGMPVETLIKRVIAGVEADTQKSGHRQVPFNYGSFTGDFCFAGCIDPAARESAEIERLRQEKAELQRRLEASTATGLEIERQQRERAARDPVLRADPQARPLADPKYVSPAGAAGALPAVASPVAMPATPKAAPAVAVSAAPATTSAAAQTHAPTQLGGAQQCKALVSQLSLGSISAAEFATRSEAAHCPTR